MVRPAQFNRDMAISAATELFWVQGYEGTSVQQLLDVMGINRSTMYASFGDKREIFLTSLRLFGDMAALACAPLRQKKVPEQAVNEFLQWVFFGLPEDKRQRGCLLVNTILEQTGLDDELAKEASAQLNKVRNELVLCFENASQAGLLGSGVVAEPLADYFLTVIKGMRVASREGLDQVALQGIIDTSLLILVEKGNHE